MNATLPDLGEGGLANLINDLRTALDAERAKAKALVEALNVAVREMVRAQSVGEVMFKTNALASGVHIGLEEALLTARAALKTAGEGQ